MLARVLAVARCLSVRLCLSVTSRCSVETDTRIDLIFWHGGFFRSVLHHALRKFKFLQKSGHFLLEFFS